ncbi:hypothetical protein OG2516_16926 [Oceanicola granulosus HTCC2516]|uniref:Uncharacterized protein n=1 Tax=Oceanicola granulosus (strain ATCC BAA-861 / DSM 15982 / KCTC 12143 / HTCC2516) TaxID=314256 RepID=Q2CFQ8_OCEGH|nr:hypothetical protein [Oceanicola granulosus]EAR51424.1 hypothetical protein OG2516_16926 [Oceanicola granulosus HTCC2516]
MSRTPIAITVVCSIWALAVSPVAPGVLEAAAMLTAMIFVLVLLLTRLYDTLTGGISLRTVRQQVRVAVLFAGGASDERKRRGFRALARAYDLELDRLAGANAAALETERLDRLLGDADLVRATLPCSVPPLEPRHVRSGLLALFEDKRLADSYGSLFDTVLRSRLARPAEPLAANSDCAPRALGLLGA